LHVRFSLYYLESSRTAHSNQLLEHRYSISDQIIKKYIYIKFMCQNTVSAMLGRNRTRWLHVGFEQVSTDLAVRSTHSEKCN